MERAEERAGDGAGDRAGDRAGDGAGDRVVVDFLGGAVDRAVDGDDGLAGALARPCSAFVAGRAARRGLTPGAVSAASLAAGALAAVWFSAGTRGGLVAGALLLAASYVLGQAAGGGPRDGWGDWPGAVLDRVREYGVYAGLAAGAAPSGWTPGGDAWWAAAALVALLSVRDAVQGSFPGRRAWPPDTLPRRAWNGLGLPPGERIALTAVTAAVADARLTFAVLLAWSSAAVAVTLAGRVKRAFA